MASSWPASLPENPVHDGSPIIGRAQKVSFQPAVGLPIDRRRGTVKIYEKNIAYKMTATQLATFKTWFWDTIEHGSIQFTVKSPRTGTTVTAAIAGDFSDLRVGADAYLVAFVLTWQE